LDRNASSQQKCAEHDEDAKMVFHGSPAFPLDAKISFNMNHWPSATRIIHNLRGHNVAQSGSLRWEIVDG
jgi:hypothetical protein